MKYLKDLLLTDISLLKGHLQTGGQRLSTLLNTTPRRFLELSDASVIGCDRSEKALTGRVLVRVDEILIAHELDESGDESLKILAERERDELTVTASFGGSALLEVVGKVSRRTLDRDAMGEHDFIIIVEPEIRPASGGEAKRYAILEGLPYLIANRGRMAFLTY